jgi:hypothetical protein
MTTVDQHILQLISTLSEDGKEAARNMLGAKRKTKKSNTEIREKLRKNLFSSSA